MDADGPADPGALDAAHAEQVRDRLLADPTAWPGPGGIDSVGVQLLISAMRAGIAPPDHLRTAPEVVELWSALGLDDAADAELSLADGRLSTGEDKG